MYVYIYTCIYIHVYIFIYIDMYIYIYIRRTLREENISSALQPKGRGSLLAYSMNGLRGRPERRLQSSCRPVSSGGHKIIRPSSTVAAKSEIWHPVNDGMRPPAIWLASDFSCKPVFPAPVAFHPIFSTMFLGQRLKLTCRPLHVVSPILETRIESTSVESEYISEHLSSYRTQLIFHCLGRREK